MLYGQYGKPYLSMEALEYESLIALTIIFIL